MKIYEAKTVFTCVCEDAPAIKTNNAESIVSYMKGAFDAQPMQESFWVIFMNQKFVATGRQMITLGTQNATLAHPREIFRAALLANSCAIACVHNHPSGDPAPSAPDMHVTRQLREAAKVIDIILVDHVIIGQADCDPNKKGFYSFRGAGLL